jgi:predicted nucleotidyltransferase
MSEINLLMTCTHGSKLYGTDTKESDIDFKGIYIPTLMDVLNNKASKNINLSTSNEERRNNSNDVDRVYTSVTRFIELLIEGSISMVELINVPKEQCQVWTPLWEELVNQKHRFTFNDTRQEFNLLGNVLRNLQNKDSREYKTFKSIITNDLFQRHWESNERNFLSTVYNTIRILYQRIDIMETGGINFPLVEAPLIRRIKTVDFDSPEFIIEVIETILKKAEMASINCTLPTTPQLHMYDDPFLKDWFYCIFEITDRL